MDGLCRCGCGQRTSIATKTRGALGHVKGQPIPWVNGHQRRQADPGEGLALCGRCDRVKPLDAFPNRARGKKGVSSWCRVCHSERATERRVPNPRPPWQIRFLEFVGDETAEGCWPWTKGADSRGYGSLSIGGKERRAHQLAHRLCGGEIPDGHHLHHTCLNKLCVNPAHLEPMEASAHHRLHHALAR